MRPSERKTKTKLTATRLNTPRILHENEKLLIENARKLNFKPRLSIVWPLSNERKRVLNQIFSGKTSIETVKGWLESEDNEIVLAGLTALNELTSVKLKAEHIDPGQLEKFAKHPDYDIKKAAGKAYVNHPAISDHELLVAIHSNKFDLVSEAGLARIDRTINEKMHEQIEEDNGALGSAQSIARFSFSLKDLEWLLMHKKATIRETARQAIIERQDAVPILQSLSENGNEQVQKIAGEALEKFPKRETANPLPQEARQLFSRKGILASDNIVDLAQKLLAVEKACKALNRKYGSGFAGVTIKGNVNYGFHNPAVKIMGYPVGESAEAFSAFEKKIAKHAGVNFALPGLAPTGYSTSPYDLFGGIFLGDRQSLLSLQKKAVEKATPETWDTYRMLWRSELDVKPREAGLSNEQTSILKIASRLLHVPPSLEEARKHVFKLARQMEESASERRKVKSKVGRFYRSIARGMRKAVKS